MNYRVLSTLVLLSLCDPSETASVKTRFPTSRGFLIYRTVSVTQKSCTCSMSFSCSCCQNVIILYTKAEKNLCVNFTYQRNGLNVDVSLDSTIIKARTVTDYKAFMFCVYVPGCLFSSACINVVELNQFPRSITACLRLDIYSKKKLWQINYDCLSISTELPMVASNSTTQMMQIPSISTSGMATQAPANMATQAPASMATQAPASMAMPTTMMTKAMTEMMTTKAAQMNSTTMSPTIEKLEKESINTSSETMKIE